MTVKQLKKILDDLDDKTIIVLSSDSEGNRFSSMVNDGSTQYLFFGENNDWSGSVLTPEDAKEEGLKKGRPCIVLWPTN